MAYDDRAQALLVLKQSEGWKIIEPYLKDAIQQALNNVMSTKKAKGMTDVAYYRGTYNAYSKLLFLIDKWIADGSKDTKKSDG